MRGPGTRLRPRVLGWRTAAYTFGIRLHLKMLGKRCLQENAASNAHSKMGIPQTPQSLLTKQW
jgi:hypothetical protein